MIDHEAYVAQQAAYVAEGLLFVGLMYNVGSLLALRNDEPRWASTGPVTGVVGTALRPFSQRRLNEKPDPIIAC